MWKQIDEFQWVEECRLEGHSDWVREVAWAPMLIRRQQTLASCGQDKRVIIWTCDSDSDATSPVGSGVDSVAAAASSARWTQTTLPEFNDAVWALSWSTAGRVLAVSCGDNTVSMWKENVDGHWMCVTDTESHTSIAKQKSTESERAI